MPLRLFEANWLKYSQRYYPDQIYPLFVSFNQLFAGSPLEGKLGRK